MPFPYKDGKQVESRVPTIKWVDQERPPSVASEEDAVSTSQQKPPSTVAKEAASKAKEKKSTKHKLVTNDSKEDLILKPVADLKPVSAHKKQPTLKSAIKTFKIDNNKLTGLKNFNDLAKDPLALPPYALPVGTEI